MKVYGMNSPGDECSRNKQNFLTMERIICLQNLKYFEKIKENKGFVYVGGAHIYTLTIVLCLLG